MRIAFLTNYIPLHLLEFHIELVKEFQAVFGTDNKKFICRHFLSTSMEANRDWKAEWGGLDVKIQSSITFIDQSKHTYGFSDSGQVFFPIGTIFDLWRFKPDIVISAEMGGRSLLAALYCSYANIPLVVWARLSAHTESVRGACRIALRRYIARHVSTFITHGRSGRDYLISIGVPARKVGIAPYALKGQMFLNTSITHEESAPLKCLILGQLIERKGVVEFITKLSRSAPSCDNAEMEIWIAGAGPQEGKIKAIKTPPQFKVRFLGHTAYEAVPALMAQCQVLVYPTLADEWGMVVNEAMAGGLLVAGSIYSQAANEMIQDGMNGFLFDPLCTNSVSNLLDKLWSLTPDALKKMRYAARLTAQTWSPQWSASRFAAAISSHFPNGMRCLKHTSGNIY